MRDMTGSRSIPPNDGSAMDVTWWIVFLVSFDKNGVLLLRLVDKLACNSEVAVVDKDVDDSMASRTLMLEDKEPIESEVTP
mmetsp:Transcript_14263/g.29961  ORF Transcript_14263/g.29961 Transcript_14263/m.29961 type:complete len:81 (+) Transcript_14263:1579-1821(+)